MEEAIIIILLIIVVVLILWRRDSFFVEKTAPVYRVGNIIGFWYTENHFEKALESVKDMAGPHDGTFSKFLIDHKASSKAPNPDILKNDNYWWDNLDAYKTVYPHFNISLRNAVDSYNEWGFTDTIGPNTCVVHMRVGDFLKNKDRTMTVDEIVKATDKLPRIPDTFEVMNGGKLHEDFLEKSTDGIRINSEEIIGSLVDRLKDKYPNSTVKTIESENADHDFYRMVKAPMLITGLGSFATMAAAANENFRLTPGFSLRENGRKNAKEENVYENWFTYV